MAHGRGPEGRTLRGDGGNEVTMSDGRLFERRSRVPLSGGAQSSNEPNCDSSQQMVSLREVGAVAHRRAPRSSGAHAVVLEGRRRWAPPSGHGWTFGYFSLRQVDPKVRGVSCPVSCP